MKFVLAAFDEFNPSALPFRNQPAALDPPLNISLCVVIRHSFKNRGAKGCSGKQGGCPKTMVNRKDHRR